MNQKVFLVHGWSVTNTSTYQALHLKLAENGFDLHEVNLGRYVTLENNVEIRDIAKAMHNALKDKLGNTWKQEFHIITHSTGALVTKQWIVYHYNDKFSQYKPLKNVVFLAAPHFGSRLAHHGKAMLAQLKYRGDTGKKALTALELGSAFNWNINKEWIKPETWIRKGIRPYNIIGDRVEKKGFISRIFPAAYEEGSDMVVRAAAGNLNFHRFELTAETERLKEVGKIERVPFCVLDKYTHSGPTQGIMNSIKRKSTPQNHLALKLILDCLKATNSTQYDTIRKRFITLTKNTRKKRKPFAQIDFRFLNDQNQPIEDYVFKLGAVKKGRERYSKTVAHAHKNNVTPNHFTVYFDLRNLEPNLEYFIEFDSSSDSELFSFKPDPLRITLPAYRISDIIRADQTTQIDVILAREPNKNLFVFHSGTDQNLHVEWNRKGEIVKEKLKVK